MAGEADWSGLVLAVVALAVATAALVHSRRDAGKLARVRAAARLIRYGVAQDLDRGGHTEAATAARCAADAIDAALHGRD